MPPSESPHSEFTGPDAGRAWRAGSPGTPARVRCLKRTRARRAGLLWGGLRCIGEGKRMAERRDRHRGVVDPDSDGARWRWRWRAILRPIRADGLMREMVAQTLTELMDLCSAHHQHCRAACADVRRPKALLDGAGRPPPRNAARRMASHQRCTSTVLHWRHHVLVVLSQYGFGRLAHNLRISSAVVIGGSGKPMVWSSCEHASSEKVNSTE